MEITSINSVSYTHLDVYKRQTESLKAVSRVDITEDMDVEDVLKIGRAHV